MTKRQTDKLHSRQQLNLAALREREGRCYRLWLLARARDADNNGCWRVPKLQRLARANGLGGAANVRDIVRQGEGTFWTSGKGRRLWLHGQARVADALGCENVGRRVEIKTGADLAQFRAELLRSLLAGKGELTISQHTLGKIGGRCRQTVSRYMADVPQAENACLDWRPAEMLNRELLKDGLFVTKVKGKLRLAGRVPRSYWLGDPRREFVDVGEVLLSVPGSWRTSRLQQKTVYAESYNDAIKAQQAGAIRTFYRKTALLRDAKGDIARWIGGAPKRAQYLDDYGRRLWLYASHVLGADTLP